MHTQDATLLRAELFSIKQLERHAVAMAGQHRIDPHPGADKLLPRLADNARVLTMAHEVVTAAALPGQRIAPAEAWLLDNYYLIEQQIVMARRHLPRGYSKQLPRLMDGDSAGFPRVYDLALALISHMDGHVDKDNVRQFIAAYQTVTPLKLGELWAFPIMLQLTLLENLRRVSVRIACLREERDQATVWADNMLTTAEQEPKQLIQLLARYAHADAPLTAPFVEEYHLRLQNQGPAMAFVQTWMEQKLLEQGVTAVQLSEAASREGAANQISIANSIGSLRFIGATDWREYVESLSMVEQALRDDPAGVHARQDFATRDRYRHVIEEVAHDSPLGEQDVARAACGLARAAAQAAGADHRTAHVGYYLVDHGRHTLERVAGCRFTWKRWGRRSGPRNRLGLYLGGILLLVALAVTGLLHLTAKLGPASWTGWEFWLIAITGALGASTLASSLVNLAVTLTLPPRLLPRLDFSLGIPEEHRTMVVVPTLVRRLQDVDDLIEALEIRYLGNRDANVFFALLTDCHDAPEAVMPGEDLLLAHARASVQALNETYCDDRPGIFFLFHRPRLWNPYENVWMGYERKRGKLEQFNALLRGGDAAAFSDVVGDIRILPTIKYVITLDTDTQLPRDTARMLIGNLAHPLNRPVFDPIKGRVVEGYAILQPRVSISLTSAGHSRFAKLFAGEAGIDPYSREVSDVYQDLFGEGSFIGKGIYDVDAFRRAVGGRFPENLILSHDLVEGGYARSALVTDVDLIEEHPASYTREASRRHRWIRGDWQLAGWLLPWVPGPSRAGEPRARRQPNPLSALSVWKIFDNIRRSLASPALLVLLACGWLMGPGAPWLWSLLVAGMLVLPDLLRAMVELVRKPADRGWLTHALLAGHSSGRPVLLSLLALVFLPYDALLCVDAILRSGLRMLFTRRGLLLWHMPLYAGRNARRSLGGFFLEMWVAPVVAVALGMALWSVRPVEMLYCAPVLLLWLVSPAVAWWISKPLKPIAQDLTDEQRTFLRVCARRTWRYFAEFVGPKDNWLPPDNFQEHQAAGIATRTSPTNMGMALLSGLMAHDFGYIPAGQLLQFIENTLISMEKLERYRGHFFNWYDTRTLQPLRPQYVSSVDSGNLLGCLLTLQTGLVELKEQPVLSPRAFHGLQDTAQVLSECISSSITSALAQKATHLHDAIALVIAGDPLRSMEAALATLGELQRQGKELLAWLPSNTAEEGELFYWAHAFNRQTQALIDEISMLSPAAPLGAPRGKAIPTLAALVIAQAQGALDRFRVIDDLMERIRLLSAMDFEFLYDTSRDLLSIGYDVGERRRDPACYDLLASEARLTSFLLIAQGQIPQKHWFTLGRLLTSHGSGLSLISWSGSMFEYLMPQLIMPSYENTLLEQTCRAAVARQMEYARQRAVPWGISESCYNAVDGLHVYQYRAFGVPGLGFKRGLGDDLVIAPYASALALLVLPREACRNLQDMAATGFLGAYGFYESADYTPSRVLRGKTHAVVRAFMAHHQGMSLLAFGHALLHRPMQRRFMASPMARATELLLQERVPKKGATLHPHATEASAARPPAADVGAILRTFTDPATPMPEVHLLSNGSYHVMVTAAGGGYSRWRDLAITRWREDVTADSWGSFIYLRDQETGRYWSTAYQPTQDAGKRYEATFAQGRAEFRRQDYALETHTEICVSPEDDVEIRRVTLTNLSSRTRYIEVTSYAEVVLAPQNSDLSHRAFSNLFVQTSILQDRQAILCTRRPRTPEEQTPLMFHLLACPGVAASEPSYETDRARFIGRGRSTANPAALNFQQGTQQLSNTQGSVLDPIVAIRRVITLLPDESATIQLITGVADKRDAVLGMLEKYCDRHFVERAFEMAWFQSQEILRHLGASETDAQLFGRLATSVVFSSATRRAAPGLIARNQLGQSGLWRFSISGDLPIVLLRIGDTTRIGLVKEVLQAHAYWRMKGLAADLVILNEDFTSYRAVLQEQIMGLVHAGPEAQALDKPGGVFVRRAEEFSEEDRVLFQTVARVVLTDAAETLAEQVERRVLPDRMPKPLEPLRRRPVEAIQPLSPRDRIFCNGLGGFTPDGREYVITLEPGQNTPAPWVNVIASPHIGTVVSESGSAYTWVENAHEFRLTNWHNDPVTDASGEALYLRDEDTGAFWSPTPLPACRGVSPSGYVCRHGFGYSVFEHTECEISSELHTYVAMDAPVKFVVIKLRNNSTRLRRLSATGYWELVLGEWRHANQMHIVTEIDPQSGALLARNAYGRECANRVAFVQVSEQASGKGRSMTGSRTEFIGRNGSLDNPACMHRKRLSGKTGAGLDPCAAIQTQIELAEGQEREVVFIFGTATHAAQAHDYFQRFSGPAGARQALEEVWRYWNHTLGAVHFETPDTALNVMANGWLLYQTISCRLWGRSGYYQSGGAYGFRDQLQDAMALVHATPWLAREQLLRCAARQFPQGDVQHWWHPPNGQGVRTHFSDDYLWLVYATCRYIQATGDTGILDEQTHFLEGREVDPKEEAYFDQPQRSPESATLYEHCGRAIKHGLRFGEHQLPLMGCGDWNDGMNRIGHGGKGESVWLAWFLFENLQRFAELARSKGDTFIAESCLQQAATLRQNIEANAWDGNWYRRAYFDDGTPLGSVSNEECQIDSISQSWAVLSGGGDPIRARQAMDAVDKRLVRRDMRLVQLLAPPFDTSALEPGYIKGYVPGVRENGGQYTHAAIWAATAFAMLGDRHRAWELFDMLNPISHGSTPEAMERYKVEPYVMCADIYGAAPHQGRGGWTWYTGAAGWMYRLTAETLLGLHREGDSLRISPCIPDDWPACMVHYRFRDTFYHITIKRISETAQHVVRVVVDGVIMGADSGISQNKDRIPLVDDRQDHNVTVELE
ncbi:GH36-type glycosyl hydrolase domain-containing protein [Megalodesulfovibrio gigas]|uniref:Cyclic beta 1-2 glucan synthetase n=1 Tax=Megalodesulfovibrio gigas (strain ATCC 19364 / DSM 1382 / NCIMB 9332 / VKM B-1759) TaxID=1121448 RepID=T2GEM8_MEGG1|nr:glucoamylase family protein [Megalodesulfovibrio gigas]AGW15050.1 hypothetical protein DGI_3357 [Megalodesulfovibrio gigas DSM 1382 = ATCC 19364]